VNNVNIETVIECLVQQMLYATFIVRKEDVVYSAAHIYHQHVTDVVRLRSERVYASPHLERMYVSWLKTC